MREKQQRESSASLLTFGAEDSMANRNTLLLDMGFRPLSEADRSNLVDQKLRRGVGRCVAFVYGPLDAGVVAEAMLHAVPSFTLGAALIPPPDARRQFSPPLVARGWRAQPSGAGGTERSRQGRAEAQGAGEQPRGARSGSDAGRATNTFAQCPFEAATAGLQQAKDRGVWDARMKNLA